MNVNDLRTKLDNIQIQSETPKQMIAFTNSEIVVVDVIGHHWVIDKLEYSLDEGKVIMSVRPTEREGV